MHSLRGNALLNIISKILSVIFPLITIPYVTGIISVEHYGDVMFASNIIMYFMLLAELGIPMYAIRNGAKIRDDNEEFVAFSREIFSLNVVSMMLSIICLIIMVLFIEANKTIIGLLAILSLNIVFKTIGAEWVNTVFEDFKSLTLRTIFTQLISLLLLFTIIKEDGDYYKYAFIMVLSASTAYLANAFYIRKYTKLSLIFPYGFIIKKHIKSILVFFVTQITIAVYVNSDGVLLGVLRDNLEVAFYSISVKVYTVFNGFVYALIAVLLPRVSYLIKKKKDLIEQHEKINLIFTIIFMMSISICILVFFLSDYIVLFLGGDMYLPASIPLKILSFASFCSVFAGLYSACILLPLGLEKISFYNTIIPAILNIILNIIFIPKYGMIAAAITTFISETIGLYFYWNYIHKFFRINIPIRVVLISFMMLIFMCLILRIVPMYISSEFMVCIFSSIIYLIIYLILMRIFLSNIFYLCFESILDKLKIK